MNDSIILTFSCIPSLLLILVTVSWISSKVISILLYVLTEVTWFTGFFTLISKSLVPASKYFYSLSRRWFNSMPIALLSIRPKNLINKPHTFLSRIEFYTYFICISSLKSKARRFTKSLCMSRSAVEGAYSFPVVYTT